MSAASESQKRYLAKPGIREARNKLNREWIASNRERYNQAKAEYRFKLKVATFMHYGNGVMACAHCGYTADIDALCLDHINDDGNVHRAQLGVAGRRSGGATTMYERLKAHGWMDGLQLLCFNCNTIKALRLKRGGRTAAEMIEATAGKTRWRK